MSLNPSLSKIEDNVVTFVKDNFLLSILIALPIVMGIYSALHFTSKNEDQREKRSKAFLLVMMSLMAIFSAMTVFVLPRVFMRNNKDLEATVAMAADRMEKSADEVILKLHAILDRLPFMARKNM